MAIRTESKQVAGPSQHGARRWSAGQLAERRALLEGAWS